MIYRTLKEKYETPRASVRGVFLCENVAVSHCPSIEGEVKYIDNGEVNLVTQAGKDIVIF